MYKPKVTSLFCGAGGFDLGFELEGYQIIDRIDNNQGCIDTIKLNRPSAQARCMDVRDYNAHDAKGTDVLLAGFPCQGFSTGGHRNPHDERNNLYREVLRIAAIAKPKIVVMENVLNLDHMKFPGTSKSFAKHIAEEFNGIGYTVCLKSHNVCHFNVPQKRRRFVFVCFLGNPSYNGWWREKTGHTTLARMFLENIPCDAANHNPSWGLGDSVHEETGEPLDQEPPIPVRLSRTASLGHPIRNLDQPFQTIDTGTNWGWAQGNVSAKKVDGLWRITASKIRQFTCREYARLQTFPDNWIFDAKSKTDCRTQVGNAVPVNFARHIAACLYDWMGAS
jgi:DNA (cytosine-5)-methyltransferase 1